jgi:hypothetical protein
MNRIVISPFGLNWSWVPDSLGPAEAKLCLNVERATEKSTGTVSFLNQFVKSLRALTLLKYPTAIPS